MCRTAGVARSGRHGIHGSKGDCCGLRQSQGLRFRVRAWGLKFSFRVFKLKLSATKSLAFHPCPTIGTILVALYELLSKLLVSPLMTPIVVPYTIPYISPFKEFKPLNPKP